MHAQDGRKAGSRSIANISHSKDNRLRNVRRTRPAYHNDSEPTGCPACPDPIQAGRSRRVDPGGSVQAGRSRRAMANHGLFSPHASRHRGRAGCRQRVRCLSVDGSGCGGWYVGMARAGGAWSRRQPTHSPNQRWRLAWQGASVCVNGHTQANAGDALAAESRPPSDGRSRKRPMSLSTRIAGHGRPGRGGVRFGNDPGE